MRSTSLGLRVHALILSGSLIFLTAFLGCRAYQIARQHLDQIETLVHHDVKTREFVVHLESASEQELKKGRETLQKDLLPTYPALASQVKTMETPSDVARVRDKLEQHSQERLHEAKQAAQGLLKTIILAVLLSAGITAWMIFLFYQGLLRPLKRLTRATDETSKGNLSYRIPAEGVGIFKFVELTELSELIRSYNSMASRLEGLDRAKSEFLQTVSHEIKNPLTALKEGMHLLANQGENLNAMSRQKTFNACLIAAKRLELMINNLLRLSRGETDLYQLEIRLGCVNKAVQAAVDEVRPLFERKKMRIELDMPENTQAAFNWDGMVQVFVNLLLNAIKYGQEGSTIRIRLDVDSQIEISITNTGKTIAASELVRIFERFYRGSNSNQTQGLGIGLHVVKQIIRAHQGDVSASSSAGLTQLRLRIPAPL
jgi:signal transduction histidine kinase